MRKYGKDSVCVETIYAYIRADKQNGGVLWKHCRHQLKHRKRQVSFPYTAVQNRTMIDQRPQEWDGFTPGKSVDGSAEERWKFSLVLFYYDFFHSVALTDYVNPGREVVNAVCYL